MDRTKQNEYPRPLSPNNSLRIPVPQERKSRSKSPVRQWVWTATHKRNKSTTSAAADKRRLKKTGLADDRRQDVIIMDSLKVPVSKNNDSTITHPKIILFQIIISISLDLELDV